VWRGCRRLEYLRFTDQQYWNVGLDREAKSTGLAVQGRAISDVRQYTPAFGACKNAE
jgi:hypothetical protein